MSRQLDREARARKVARLWASGLSIREVARRVGIHHQTAIDDLARLDPAGSWDTYRERRQQRRVPVRDKRMTEAVRLRATGLSLRQIAVELGVSYQTVSNDLARWDAQRPKLPANVIALSKTGVKNVAPGVTNETPEVDTGSSIVIPLVRKTSRSGGSM